MSDWRTHDISARHRIASRGTPGLELVLRQRGDRGPPVLFVHGATFSGRLFDIPHPGLNWLQVAADAGFSAYAIDIRGYGLSKPEAFPAGRTYATGDEAIADIGDAVDWIAERHGGAQVALVGWSWGTLTTSRYVAGPGAGKVSALALYAPIYAEVNDDWIAVMADPTDRTRHRDFGPYRHVDLADTRARWDAQLPQGADWRDEAVLQAMVASSIADDGGDNAYFRVPNGTFLDLWECFNGRPIHDPGAVTCPTLLVRGAQDPTATRSDSLALFDRLGAADRSYVEIAGGTHFINAETRAPALFAAVNSFLRRTHGR
ncbi:alpha/beta fold hydrolase [Rhodobacterales bacterium LSUCC0031]|nr:alpha/beta fold hydrolase [Rhodobacterales bacterium LSUCC0031]